MSFVYLVIKTYNLFKFKTIVLVGSDNMAKRNRKLSGKDQMADYTKSAIAFAGGPSALARHIRAEGHTITTQAISQWLLVPGERVLLVEKAANEKVNRYQMRPDVFGDGQ
jgi:DNA-binding transcriptional regulator YdaS (Cro superfamily)